MADQPITSAAASLGSSGANTLLRYLETQFVRAARNTGMPMKFTMDVSGAVASKGNQVGVYIAPDITSSLLTDGSAATQDDTPGTTSNVTLNRHRYTKFSLTQVARALDGDFTTQKLLDSRIVGVLNGVEEDVLSLATSFTTNANAGTFNTALTEAECAEATRKLMSQKAPGPYIALVKAGDVTTWEALVQIANFTQANTSGKENPVFNLGYGQGRFFHGAYYFYCHGVNQSGTSTSNLVYSQNAIAVAMRLPAQPMSPGVAVQNIVDSESGIAFQVVMNFNGDRLADEITVHTLYGYGITKNAYGVELRS